MDLRELIENTDFGYVQPKELPWLYISGAKKLAEKEGLKAEFELTIENDVVTVVCILKKDETKVKGFGLASSIEKPEWSTEPKKFLYEIYQLAKERAYIDAVINYFKLYDKFKVPAIQTHPEINKLKTELWNIVKSRRIDKDKAIKYISKFEQTPENYVKLIELFKNSTEQQIEDLLQ